jgi:hypothetical protein
MTDWRRRHIVSAAAAAGGLALFAHAVRQAGLDQILAHVSRVGWGLVAIIALAGVRFVLRAEAWRLCTPVGSRLTLRGAFAAFLAGDALGNVTPLGPIASEPTKMMLTRHHLATRQSVASLAVDNLVYAISIAIMLAVGLVTMVATVPLSMQAREVSAALLTAVGLASAGGVYALRRREPVDGRTGWLERLNGAWQSVLLSAGNPARLWRSFVFHMLFHIVAVFEAFLVLRWLMGPDSPTFANALMFESVNRVVTVVFKIVPLRVGIDEAASGAFASLVGVSPAYGVALAVVRKIRSLFWVGTGLTLIAVHHFQDRPSTGKVPSQAIPARSGPRNRAPA